MRTFLFLLLTLCIGFADDVTPLLRKSDLLDRQLNTAAALDVLAEAERADPDNVEVLYRLAKQHSLTMSDTTSVPEKIARGKKALTYAERAVQIDPKNADAQLALAITYARLAALLDNRTKISYSRKIKEHAELALALESSNELACHVLGAWHYELANLNPMLRAIASAIYGKLPPASNAEAVRYFTRAIALNPGRVANHVELGRTYAAMGNKPLARAELEKGIALPNQERDDRESKRRAREALAKL